MGGGFSFFLFSKGMAGHFLFSFCKRNGGGFSFDKLLQFYFRREEQSVCLIKSADITFLKKSILNFCVCNHCSEFNTNCLNTVFRLTSGISSGTLPIQDRSLMLQKCTCQSISTQPFVVNLVSLLVDFQY